MRVFSNFSKRNLFHFIEAVKKCWCSSIVCILGSISFIALLNFLKISSEQLIVQFLIGTWASILATSLLNITICYKKSLRTSQLILTEITNLNTKIKADCSQYNILELDWCKNNKDFLNATYNHLCVVALDLSYFKDYDIFSREYNEMMQLLNNNTNNGCAFKKQYEKVIQASNKI